MSKLLRVLLVEDSDDDAQSLLRELRRGGYDPLYERVDTRAAMRAALTRPAWDVILSDYALPHFSGLDALAVLKESGLDLPFIALSGVLSEEQAGAVMRAGAHDFVVKGNMARFLPALERELREAEVRRARQRAEEATRRHAARAEALVRVAARLNAHLDLPAVLNAVCEEAAHALNVPAAAAALYDPKREVIYHAADFGLPPDYRERHIPLPRTLYDELARQQGPLMVTPDVRALPAETPNLDLFAALDIRTIVAASMRREGQLVGGLSLFTFGEVCDFTEDELALLKGLADQAAQAIVNARLLAEAQSHVEHLQALRNIDIAIMASTDLRITLTILLDETVRQLRVDAADVLLLNPHTQTLAYAAGRGFRTQALQHTRLRLGEGNAGRAALERRIVTIPNLPEGGEAFVRAPLLLGEGFIAYYAVPLLTKGQVIGVLEIFHRSALDPAPDWLDFLEMLAGQAAIAIDNATLFEDLQRSNARLAQAYDTTLEGWSRALDLRDHETEGHTRRVTDMTVRLAREIGFDDGKLIHVRRGALLHDIGKMGIPDGILLKPAPLTPAEWEVMRQHPLYAYELLWPIDFLRPALEIPYEHHERWDGAGYPRGLKGEQIPLAARLFTVVDVWDALRSERPYRPSWPEAQVHEYIYSHTGTHFDPQAVDLFFQVVSDGLETAPNFP